MYGAENEGGVFLMRYLLAECCGDGVGGPL
jgi:hypothetical protein